MDCYWVFYFISRFRSGDGTARIWSINDSKAPPIVLQHASESDTKDVTTLDWHPTGQVLATGSYDGIARIWTIQGKALIIEN
jgi:transducin (beta)-like 1